MTSLPIPLPFLKLNDWTKDKTLLIWKFVSLGACIIGTISYYSPLEPYLEVPCFGILVPTFIIGYLIIISTEILILFAQEDYMLIEICFNAIGAIGSLVCGIYEFYKWISWIVDAVNDPERDYKVCPSLSEFTLSIALIAHSVSTTAVVVHHILLVYRRSSSDEHN